MSAKNRVLTLVLLIAVVPMTLSGCFAGTINGFTDEEIPNLKFSAVKTDDLGNDCFYLFDDNPEHLHSEYLADAEEPSSVAHFGGLTKGIYTVFSYHHRGDCADSDTDLFFDTLFRGEETAEIKIHRIGLNRDWDWNSVWADYSGTEVYAPEYLQTFDCKCADGCKCGEADGSCGGGCGCVKYDELTVPNRGKYGSLEEVYCVEGNDKLLLSEMLSGISENRLNEIRHGGYNEPIWLMLQFEVLSGKVSFDTIAYTDKETAKSNFDIMKNGRYEKEPQFKGKADNAPIVCAEISYEIDGDVKTGALPIRIFNQRYPDGFTAKNGQFGTNVNTWKMKSLISAESAESDMLRLVYEDESKSELYGSDIPNESRDNIWHFDPFYTSLYSDKENTGFIPNLPMSKVKFPKGGRAVPDDFYLKYVCNLGNFGVAYRYTFNLKNVDSADAEFVFSMNSVSGHVYRFNFTDESGNVLRDDGGRYIVKKYDKDPAVNPKNRAERLKPQKYTTSEKFTLEAGRTYKVSFELVTLTGCDAPITISLGVIR